VVDEECSSIVPRFMSGSSRLLEQHHGTRRVAPPRWLGAGSGFTLSASIFSAPAKRCRRTSASSCHRVVEAQPSPNKIRVESMESAHIGAWPTSRATGSSVAWTTASFTSFWPSPSTLRDVGRAA
jgi:hypothetical protein